VENYRIRRLVFTSSREVYGEPIRLPVKEIDRLLPINEYGKSKLAAEKSLFDMDIDVSILRLSNVFGNGDHERIVPTFIEAAKSGSPLKIYGSLEKQVDLVHLQDVVTSLVTAGFMKNNPRIPINIGGGMSLTAIELAKMVINEFQSNSHIQEVPSRGKEVLRFEADITRATKYFDLQPISSSLIKKCLRSLKQNRNFSRFG
jgi:nucleoside-diphosphate-sugar epimerase